MIALYATLSTVLYTAKARLTNEKGATMVEYGLMVALIAVVVIAGLLILGPRIAGLFTGVAARLNP
ncbi:Flp family type IVb pilin [Arthrobacter sp. Br18]|uniref:Flp family type IVb pilin n=1 Tax=Arthrobacter sp. Br18 TaxID=1312954 RepID=UPI00047DA0A2|nr:Flp family type IVb pilin [Arthrobacter sp. Br18]